MHKERICTIREALLHQLLSWKFPATGNLTRSKLSSLYLVVVAGSLKKSKGLPKFAIVDWDVMKKHVKNSTGKCKTVRPPSSLFSAVEKVRHINNLCGHFEFDSRRQHDVGNH